MPAQFHDMCRFLWLREETSLQDAPCLSPPTAPCSQYKYIPMPHTYVHIWFIYVHIPLPEEETSLQDAPALSPLSAPSSQYKPNICEKMEAFNMHWKQELIEITFIFSGHKKKNYPLTLYFWYVYVLYIHRKVTRSNIISTWVPERFLELHL